MIMKVDYFKTCLGGSEVRDGKVLPGDEIRNINRRLIVEDLNYQLRKFRFYFKGS